MADNQRKDRERQGLVFRVEWNGMARFIEAARLLHDFLCWCRWLVGRWPNESSLQLQIDSGRSVGRCEGIVQLQVHLLSC